MPATEVVMPEITQAITEIPMPEVTPPIDYHLNPVFDYSPLFGWPLWVWIFIALGIVFVIVNLKWVRRRLIMGPFLPYLEALKGGKQEDQQVWMIGKNKSFHIEHLKYNADGVISYFKYLQNLAMWYLGEVWAVGHAGGIKSVIISDNYDTVRDPVAEIALYTAIENYNEKHKEPAVSPDGKILLDENGQQLYRYPIYDYNSFDLHRDDLVRENPLGPEIDSFSVFDVVKGVQFFPKNRTAGMFGGDCIREARKKNIDKTATPLLTKLAPVGAALVFVIIALFVTYMFTHG